MLNFGDGLVVGHIFQWSFDVGALRNVLVGLAQPQGELVRYWFGAEREWS